MLRSHSYDLATTSSVYPQGHESTPEKDEQTIRRPSQTPADSRASSGWWPSYPSWLPRRPSPPHPPTTRPTSAEQDDEQEIPMPEPSVSSGYGRVATPRSVRILSKPSHGPGGALQGRHQGTDETQVGTEAAALKEARRSRQSWVKPRRPRFRAPALRLEQLESPSLFIRFRYLSLPVIVFYHLALQTFFDLNAVYMLIQVAKFPSPTSIAPASGRTWALATAAYIFCWTIQIFGIFILYELAYSFYRRWRTKRPLIGPLYLSAPAHNLVSITSYQNFCFFRYIRRSASRSKLGDHSGSTLDGLAERCFFFSQNLPTVATLLPRAALCLALLFTFALPATGEATGVASRDSTFFHISNGTLTAYGKGILIANATWTAWRTLVVLGSFCGLWILSGKACAGLCGPRHRYDEEDEREERATQSIYFGSGMEDGPPEQFDALGWEWRERTHNRIKYAWNFCLTTLPEKADISVTPESRPAPIKSSLPAEDLDRILASAGFAEPPMPAKRRDRSLPQDFFDDPIAPSPTQELSDILPPPSSSPVPGKGKDAPLMQLPHPFNVPSTSSPSKSSPGAPDPFAAGSANVPFPFTVFDDEPAGQSQPAPTAVRLSQYEESTDEDIENEIIGAFEVTEEYPSSPVEQQPPSGRPSSSLSSLGQPLPRRISGLYPFSRQRPGGRSSEEEVQVTVDSGSSKSGHSGDKADTSFPAPPSTRSSRRPRSKSGPTPPSSASGSVESRSRQHLRNRTMSGISGASSKRGEPQPEPEPDSMIMSEQGDLEVDEVEAAEREDSVGLLSPNVSPRSSLRGSRRRSTKRSNGSRSGSASLRSGSNGSRSPSYSTDGSFRSRAQSLVQAAMAPVVARSRSRAHSAASSLSPPTGRISEESNLSDRDQHTFGQAIPWLRRVAGSPQRQAGSSEEGSHSRQASSGSAFSSVPNARVSVEGDHTFGQPLPLHMRHPERVDESPSPKEESAPAAISATDLEPDVEPSPSPTKRKEEDP